MRVIAGQFRGRSLAAPSGRTTRPITDRVKENLFNILGHRFALPGQLPAVDVLDLFSGPGSLGIEALSRGARTCVFVERDRAALRALRQNLAALRLAPVTCVLAENAWTMRPPLRFPATPAVEPSAGEAARGFGLIFVDPPFRDATEVLQVADLFERLAPALAPGGVLVFRHEVPTPPPSADTLRDLQYFDERVYGRMRLLFLARRPAP